MEVLNGLFRSSCFYIGKDNFGGNVFEIYEYIYIYIYEKTSCFSIIGNTLDFDDREILQKSFDNLLETSLHAINRNTSQKSINIVLSNGLNIYGGIIEKKSELNLSARGKNGRVLWKNIVFKQLELGEIKRSAPVDL